MDIDHLYRDLCSFCYINKSFKVWEVSFDLNGCLSVNPVTVSFWHKLPVGAKFPGYDFLSCNPT